MESTSNCLSFSRVEFKKLAPGEREPESCMSSITLFFEKCVNSFLLVYKGEMYGPLKGRASSQNLINRFALFGNSWYLVTNPVIAKALLKYARVGDNKEDPFGKSLTIKFFEDNLLNLDSNITSKNALFFANLHDNKRLRGPIVQALSKENINDHELIVNFLKRFEKDLLDNDLFIESDELLVIYKIAFLCEIGLKCPPLEWEDYIKLHLSMAELHNYAFERTVNEKKGIFGKKTTQKEQESYEEALKILRERFTQIIESTKDIEGSLVNLMLYKENRGERVFSHEDILCNLFACIEGGSANPKQMAKFTLWELGQHMDYQNMLYEALKSSEEKNLVNLATSSKEIQECRNETLRLYSLLIVPREFESDTELNLYDENDEIVYTHQFARGDALHYSPCLAGRDGSSYDNPETWNPKRVAMSTPPFSFGAGRHLCPGKYLEELSTSLFIAYFLRKYSIESSPNKITLFSKDALESKEKIMLKFSPRHRIWNAALEDADKVKED